MPTFEFWLSLAGTLAVVLTTALGLQVVPSIGLYGRKRAERLAHQPWVDIYIFALVALPWVACFLIAGFAGLMGAITGQLLSVAAWSLLHLQAHAKKDRGPSTIKALARRVGIVRTYAALLLTLAALPLLIGLRVLQLTAWPIFSRLMKLPRERHSMYFSFTRHQAKGIAGLDLLWALYTEWAIGVWSMSGHIMRHAASLWSPIRFADDAKNHACAVDFPDITRWAQPGSLEGAVRLIEQMHGNGSNAWFGHASRAASAPASETAEQSEESPAGETSKQAA